LPDGCESSLKSGLLDTSVPQIPTPLHKVNTMTQNHAKSTASVSLSDMDRSILRRLAEHHGIPETDLLDLVSREKPWEAAFQLPENRGSLQPRGGGSQ